MRIDESCKGSRRGGGWKRALGMVAAAGLLATGSGVAQAAPAVGGAKSVTQPITPTKDADHLRPANGFFPGGGFFDTQWHFKGASGHQGQIVSKDVVFNMDALDWDDKTKQGVAIGSPRVIDTHNTVTAEKMTIFDAGAPDVRKVVLDGHVKIVHRPDQAKDAKPSGDDLSDVLSHDVILTCDHAEYYYRAKRSVATGHPKLEGLNKDKDKLVPVTLTADRLESEDKQNLYRAIGNVLVTEPDRSISSPLMTAVVEDQGDGNRKVQTITLAPPVRFTGMIDNSDDTGTPASTSSTATVGGTAVSAGGTATVGGTTSSAGGAVTTGGTSAIGGTAPATSDGSAGGPAPAAGTGGGTTPAAGSGSSPPTAPSPPPAAGAEATTPKTAP